VGLLALRRGVPFFIAMKTIVYIDGLNFYYRCVKNTPYKWLDFKKLVQRLTRETRQIVEIKYFTSNIRGNPLRHTRQKVYLSALETHIPELRIYRGLFQVNDAIMLNADPPPKKVFVKKTEEKRTDVNIAVNLLDDAWTDSYECAIVVSNDSDLTEAVRTVRLRHPQKHITVMVTPPTFKGDRHISRHLTRRAHSVIEITEADLAASQLPDSVPGKKPGTKIQKPKEWQS